MRDYFRELNTFGYDAVTKFVRPFHSSLHAKPINGGHLTSAHRRAEQSWQISTSNPIKLPGYLQVFEESDEQWQQYFAGLSVGPLLVEYGRIWPRTMKAQFEKC